MRESNEDVANAGAGAVRAEESQRPWFYRVWSPPHKAPDGSAAENSSDHTSSFLDEPEAPEYPKLVHVKSKMDFGVESYKQIRTEVAVLLARIENLFRYSLLATAGVFSWLLTQAFGTMEKRPASGVPTAVTCFKLPPEAMLVAWWIPTAFVVLSGVITLATHIRIMQMSGYLRMCECTLGYEKLSWEAYLAPKPPLFFTTTAIAWVLLLGASIGVALTGIGIQAGLCVPK